MTTSVCILFGGKSGEHDVSRRSAASVVRHLDRSQYAITAIGIARDGRWHLQNELTLEKVTGGEESLVVVPSDRRLSLVPAEGLQSDGQPLAIDCVFPVLHGSYGEDGKLQGALETAGLPYVGAGVLGSSASMDKAIAKALWRDAGLPIVDFAVIDASTGDGEVFDAVERFGWPLFVKPSCGGSSLGASRACNLEELQQAISVALGYDCRVIVEPCLQVRELECSVLGNADVHAYPPGEVITGSQHTFYDYDAKYTDPVGASLQTVAELNPALRQRLVEMAASAYRAVRCEGMARVDFFLEKESGLLFLNEINTIPGFTSISMFPRMCENAGLAYPELLDRLIALALARGASAGLTSTGRP